MGISTSNKGHGVQQYSDHVELKEPRFFEIKIPTVLLIISVFVFQLILHISTATLSSVAAKQNILSFEGLQAFTIDMWFIAILFSLGLFGYTKIKKYNEVLLVVFLALPSLVVLLSLVRNVSSLLILVLVGVITFLIYRFNYQKLTAKLLVDAAHHQSHK